MATFKIDIDGVLRNLIYTLCEIYNKEFNTNVKPEEVYNYNVDESFPLVKEKLGISAVKYFFDDNGRQVFLMSPKIKNVSIALNKLHTAGHRIIIVSYQRSHENKIDTLDWLKHNSIYYDDVCFTNKKYLIHGDYLVDDNLEFLNEQNLNDKNVKCVCIKAPYNMHNNIYDSYDSLNDFVNCFLKA